MNGQGRRFSGFSAGAMAIALGMSGAAGAAAPTNINVETTISRGICFLAFPLGGGSAQKLEFSLRSSDRNFGVSVINPGDVFDGKDMDRTNYPMTLKTDTGEGPASAFGRYNQGFELAVQGGWSQGVRSEAAFQTLAKAKSATLTFDGKSYGPFNLQSPGFAWTWLNQCAADEKAKAGG